MVEVSNFYQLRFKLNGGTILVYTYEDGRVKAPEIVAPLISNVQIFSQVMTKVHEWSQAIANLEGLESNTLPETPFKIEYEVTQNKIKSEITGPNHFEVKQEYDRSSKVLTVFPRPAWDISWSCFLCLIGEGDRFLELLWRAQKS